MGLDITEQGITGYDGLSAQELLTKFIDFASKGYVKGMSRILLTLATKMNGDLKQFL